MRILGAVFTFTGLFWLVESNHREEFFGWWHLAKVVLGILFVGFGVLFLLARVVAPKDT